MSERQIQCRDGQLLAVTTRSRLRSARLFPAMLLATWAIRRQLARTEGLVRWASLVAGPTEFWTITVWRTRHAMQEFMRSDAHGRIMWRYTRWLAGRVVVDAMAPRSSGGRLLGRRHPHAAGQGPPGPAGDRRA